MSGGSFDYLFTKVDDLGQAADSLRLLQEMKARMIEHGLPHVAKELEPLIDILSDCAFKLHVEGRRVEKLLKAFEWYCSSDWGINDVLSEYTDLHPFIPIDSQTQAYLLSVSDE